MQAPFAPESTTRSIHALSPQRLVDSAALHPPLYAVASTIIEFCQHLPGKM
jgi:hypothetical protein